MSSSEDCEMLEICEADTDDLKPKEELTKDTVKDLPPKPSTQSSEELPPKKDVSTINFDDDAKSLHLSLKINVSDPKESAHFRLDTLHICGVDEMNTKDVYAVFQPLQPLSLEWINDTACNVVWENEITAAKALLQVSLPLEEGRSPLVAAQIPSPMDKGEEAAKEPPSVQGPEKVLTKDSNEIIMMDEEEEEGSEDGELVDDKPDKVLIWRRAVLPNGNILKLRYATRDDKKVRGAEKHSEYYRKYGNPNFGGLTGLISSSRKRRMRGILEPDDDPLGLLEETTKDHDLEPDFKLGDARLRISQIAAGKAEQKEASVKRPKMKMYADEEERKTPKHKLQGVNPWKTVSDKTFDPPNKFSRNVLKRSSRRVPAKTTRVSNRLGNIMVNFSLNPERYQDWEDEPEREYDDLEISSPREFGSKSVWDRLQVEVPNARSSSSDDKRRSRHSGHSESHKTSDSRGHRDDLRGRRDEIRSHREDSRSHGDDSRSHGDDRGHGDDRSHRNDGRGHRDDSRGHRDLRKKLQRIRDDKKKDHRSPLLIDASSR